MTRLPQGDDLSGNKVDPPTQRTRILCIDSDVSKLALLSNVLAREGFQVQTARDGQAGLIKARELKPDLVIMDVLLPDLDGYAVCRQLKADSENARMGVIILTTQGGVDEPVDEAWRFSNRVMDRVKGYDSGALEFLTEPVTARELVQRVRATLWAAGFPSVKPRA